ncbi:unnamed protein product [Boreogadus saida]
MITNWPSGDYRLRAGRRAGDSTCSCLFSPTAKIKGPAVSMATVTTSNQVMKAICRDGSLQQQTKAS